jgi:anti-anti-sigma factor
MEKARTVIDVDAARDGPLVTIAGKLDTANAPELAKVCADTMAWATTTVTLDLSQVPSIDSTAISTLIRLRLLAADRRISLVLLNPSARVESALDIMSLDQAFDIRHSTPDAPT